MDSNTVGGGVDALFFPSSPLFRAESGLDLLQQSGAAPQCDGHVGASLPYASDMLPLDRLPSDMMNPHSTIGMKQHVMIPMPSLQAQQSVMEIPARLESPSADVASSQTQQYEWNTPNTAIGMMTQSHQHAHTMHQPPTQMDGYHHASQQAVESPRMDGSASSASSASSSGHSTPTFVYADAPEQADEQQQQLRQQHGMYGHVVSPHHQAVHHHPPPLLYHSMSTSSSSSSSASVSSQESSMSPLDQFACTIPHMPEESSIVGTRRPVKAKRERKSARIQAQTHSHSHVHAHHTAAMQHSSAAYPSFLSRQEVYGGGASTLSDDSRASDVRSPAMSMRQPATAPGSSSRATHHQHASSSSAAAAASFSSTEENNEPHADDSEETKRRKLARKAELARLSRKRKKTRLTDLEGEVRRLEEELEQVKRGKHVHAVTTLSANIMAEADQQAEHRMREVTQAMVHAVESGVVQATAAAAASQPAARCPTLTGIDMVSRSQPTALTPLIDGFMAAYNAQQANCTKHLEQMQLHHMQPSPTLDALHRLLKQSQESSGDLWNSVLCRELNLSGDSRELRELNALRLSLSAQHCFDGEVARALTKLSQLMLKRQTQQNKNLNRIRAILSEEQFVRYVHFCQQQKIKQEIKKEEQM